VARAIGLSRERLSRIRAACPPLQGKGPYAIAPIQAWLDKNHPEWRERAALQAGATSPVSAAVSERIAEARARKLTADAELSEIELALRRREAWPATIVRARWAALASALRARLEALCVTELPARLGGAPTADLAAAYREGLRALLADFSEESFTAQVLADQRKEETTRR
jgi:hypothetical protein